MISVIIPVYNEAASISGLLNHLDTHSKSGKITEVIIVDGGSTDETIPLARSFSENGSRLPLVICESEKGRARQMNAGANIARGDVLYFLHADTFPPAGFDDAILKQVQNGNNAGCFRMKFDSKHPVLIFSQYFTRFNFKACRGGDQSLFVVRRIFDSLNGFDEEFEIYEDCDFIGKIYDQYKFTVIKDYVITSARKYARNGTMKLQYHFTMIHIKKWLGADAAELSRYYKKHILT